MSITLYNTLTRKKEPFTPIDPANVRMYVCGPTVYDFAHIGNARPVIVFDVLFRLLRHVYGEDHVRYVRNITDVDDKINDRAARDYPDLPLNEAIRKVTESTAQQFYADVKALGCDEPNEQPRATDNIKEMVEIIQRLLNTDHAYIAAGAQGREVLFAVGSMPAYGALSNRKLDEQIEGARVAVEAHKRNPADFVLWKESAATEPGWSAAFSEAGQQVSIYGRPGWHIECSAMSHRYLGETFDIHGGGIDLVFPHHENEIAQSCCAFDTPRMANVWMHNGFLQVEGQKMSKSLGNFVTIHELRYSQKFGGRSWRGDAIRFAMLKTNYRQPIDWTISLLSEAKDNLEFLSRQRYRFTPTQPDPDFLACLYDDLNTKAAIDLLLDQAHRASQGDMKAGGHLAANLILLGFFTSQLGRHGLEFQRDAAGKPIVDVRNLANGMPKLFTENTPAKWALRQLDNRPDIFPDEVRRPLQDIAFFVSEDATVFDLYADYDRTLRINELVFARIEARKTKNFAESDRIRDELVAMGIQLKDGKDADGNLTTEWEVKR